MGLLLPVALFFGLSIPALLIFYLLKVRRKPRHVASTWLWRDAIEDARASVPFQRLRRNLLMFLQIATLTLITLALGRPVLNLALRESGSAILLVDVSASMGMRARPGGPTRLAEAQDKAARFVASLPQGSQGLLIAYSDRASVAAPFTTDRAKLRSAVQSLTVQAASDHLSEALTLAASLVESAPNPRLVIFSDTASVTAEQLELLGSTPVVIEACGTEAPNFGWVSLDLRKASPTSDLYDLFGQIAAFGLEEQQEARVQIMADESILEVRRVRLLPGAETPLVLEGVELSGQPVLHAMAQTEGQGFDGLEMDNHVWVRVRPSEDLRLLLCTEGNYFLSRALASAGSVEIVTVAPGQPAPPGHFDLAIYDRALPLAPLPVPALYIAVPPWPEAVATPPDQPEGEPALAVGEITNWDPDHPVTQLVQWSTVTVFAARPTAQPPGTRVLVDSGEWPLLLLGRAQNQVTLYLAFDLFESNFPFRAAFMIFVKNVIDFLTSGRAGREVYGLRGGETYSAAVPLEARRVTLISPDNKGWQLRPGPDQRVTFAETYAPGLWRLEVDGAPAESFGVNVMDARETDPAVVASSAIGAGGEIRPGGLGSELRANREIWPWIAAVALLLLMIEWWAYQRGLAS